MNTESNAAEFETESDDVFGRIARRYDLLCDLFSMGIHRLWKRRVAFVIAREPWTDLLDMATGTGDIVLRLSDNLGDISNKNIIASDISEAMLNKAKLRLANSKHNIEYKLLNAHAIPSIPDASVDLYSMSLGLKICDRKKAMNEALRVLRPGGRLVILEASNIKWNWLHKLYLRYMSLCIV